MKVSERMVVVVVVAAASVDVARLLGAVAAVVVVVGAVAHQLWLHRFVPAFGFLCLCLPAKAIFKLKFCQFFKIEFD